MVAAAVGSNATPNSGAATTTAANELIVGADLTTGATVAAGSGFTSRMITVPDADIAEDQVVASTGSYAATASAPGGPWLMQMATFKAAGAGAPATPSAPGTLTASAAGVTAVNLSWGAATETGGTIAQYLIERCQGAGCSNFAQIGTASAPTTSFADSGLTGSSSYSYRVRAKDASGNTGPYSNSATAVTATATPGAPADSGGERRGQRADQSHLECGDGNRRHDRAVPDRALPGRRLQQLHAGRHRHHARLQRHRPERLDSLQLPRARQGHRGHHGAVLQCRQREHRGGYPDDQRAGSTHRERHQRHPDHAQLGRGHRNRRHPEPVPHRALPGRRLQQLHAGRRR